MGETTKREILHAILRPTDEQRDIYGNIESYYRYYIDRTMRAASSCVRSQYHCLCYVFFSRADNVLVAEYTINYRLFPSQTGYKDITVAFDAEHDSKVRYERLMLSFPDGTVKNFSKLDSTVPIKVEGHTRKWVIPVQELASNQPHIDVSFCVMQRGQDHWIQVGVKALEPTDGFHFAIHCEEPIAIMEEATFIYGAHHTKEPEDVKGSGRATIKCNQWIDQGAGVSVVIGVPHDIDQAVLDDLGSRTHGARRPGCSSDWTLLYEDRKEATSSNSPEGLKAVPGSPAVNDVPVQSDEIREDQQSQ